MACGVRVHGAGGPTQLRNLTEVGTAGRGNEGYDGEREPAVDWALTWRFRRLDCKQWEDWEVLRA